MMNMMQMVGIMVACYFVTLTLLCVYRKIINVKVGNAVFIIVDLVFFLGWNYAAYQRGWLSDGFMTLENISPFIMTLIPLTVFMSEKVRSYCNSAIAFLWIGMFIALIFSPQHAYIFSYHIDASLIYSTEAACHLLASLYGFYLIMTEQVKCDFKHWLKSIVCMFSVIGFGVILNYIFHLRNFGMDPYGQASIYMIDILGSFEATLLAYLLGVAVVLTLGLQVGYLFNKLVSSTSFYDKENDKAEAVAPDSAVGEIGNETVATTEIEAEKAEVEAGETEEEIV